MPKVLDGLIEMGPLPTPALLKPKTITKAQVQKCINQLSPYWDDEQLEVIVSIFLRAWPAVSGMIGGLLNDKVLTESDVLIGV